MMNNATHTSGQKSSKQVVLIAIAFAVVGTLLLIVTLAQGPGSGDLNKDGLVDETDHQILVQNYGKGAAAEADGDLNGDGVVNHADLAILIGRKNQQQ